MLESIQREEEARRVTELAREVELPTGIGPFDLAWESLSEDRPHTPPERCPMRRKLIKMYYDELTDG